MFAKSLFSCISVWDSELNCWPLSKCVQAWETDIYDRLCQRKAQWWFFARKWDERWSGHGLTRRIWLGYFCMALANFLIIHFKSFLWLNGVIAWLWEWNEGLEIHVRLLRLQIVKNAGCCYYTTLVWFEQHDQQAALSRHPRELPNKYLIPQILCCGWFLYASVS